MPAAATVVSPCQAADLEEEHQRQLRFEESERQRLAALEEAERQRLARLAQAEQDRLKSQRDEAALLVARVDAVEAAAKAYAPQEVEALASCVAATRALLADAAFTGGSAEECAEGLARWEAAVVHCERLLAACGQVTCRCRAALCVLSAAHRPRLPSVHPSVCVCVCVARGQASPCRL